MTTQAAPLIDKTARRRHTLVTALAAAAMMLALLALLGVWPFGDGSVLTGDLNGQYTSYFAHFKRALTGDGGFFYGFDKALGGPLVALFAYYVSSPLNLLYLLFPVSAFPVAASVLLVVKVTLASVFFQIFAANRFPNLGWRSVLSGLCYGFCAYTFVYAQNIMWHDVLLLLPLVCLGLERILAGKTNRLYLITLSLAIWANFYIAFMACIFCVLYFAAGLVLRGTKGAALKKPLLSFAGGSAFAGGINGVLLLPTLANLNASKGELLDYSFSFAPKFFLPDLPQKLLWGSFAAPADTQAGLPLLYCGLVIPLLALCFFVSSKIGRKEKLVAGAGLAVMLLSLWVTGLDTLWHGLKEPVWFPYRNAFLVVFLLVVIASAALAKGAVGRRELLISTGVLAAVILLYLIFPRGMGRAKLLACLAGLALWALLWLLYNRPGLPKRALAAVAVLAVMAELAANAYYITDQFEKYPTSTYQAFVADTGSSVAAIGAADAGLYRIEKNDFRSFNDPMLLDYHGLSHFGSTQDNAVTDTLYNLGYQGYPSYLYGSTAFADSVLGLRYLMDTGARALPAHWQQSGIEAPLPVLENPTALPLIFATEARGLAEIEAGTAADSFSYQNELYTALTGDEAPLFEVVSFRLIGGDGLSMPMTDSIFPGEHYQFTARKEGYYYLLAQGAGGALYDVEAVVNDQPVGRYLSADHSGVLNLGYREAGETVRVGFGGEGLLSFSALSVAVMEPHKLEALTEAAHSRAAQATLSDGRVEGSASAKAGELLFTSLPYDAGWTATLNGHEVAPVRLAGGLLGLELEEGDNSFMLRYKQAGLLPGLLVSGGTLLLFVGWVLVARRRKAMGE